MKRPLAGILLAAGLLSQAVLAPAAMADIGRYQLVPNAQVPDPSGALQSQTVLLDTSTGRTWRLGDGAQSGQAKGPRWVPLDITFADRVSSAAATKATARSAAGSKADTKPAHKVWKNRLGEDYDTDP